MSNPNAVGEDTNVLPNSIAELVKIAVADLEECEKNPNYTIAMMTWHQPQTLRFDGVICAVCLAGAVMAQTLDLDATIRGLPGESNNGHKLRVLNFLRDGSVIVHGRLDPVYATEPVPPYSTDPDEFKENIVKFAEELTALGITADDIVA